MAFFFAIVADDGEVLGTAPSRAPGAALITLHREQDREQEETSFPREIHAERWHYYGLGGGIVRRETLDLDAGATS